MGIDQQLLSEIVTRLLQVTSPEKIILFGSAATGEMTRDSDIDLLIVKKEMPIGREEWLRAARALRGLGYPFDVMFIASDRFEESKNVVGGIAYPANKYGKIIYEAA